MLNDLKNGVLLNFLDENEQVFAVEAEFDNRVLLADDQTDLVGGHCHMTHVRSVTVDNCGHLARCAQTTGKALAELRAGLANNVIS